jgi:hypothetical protein
MAAAASAAEQDACRGIVGDNFRLGGKIWRVEAEGNADDTRHKTSKRVERLRGSRVPLLCGPRVVHRPAAGVLLAEGRDGSRIANRKHSFFLSGSRSRFRPRSSPASVETLAALAGHLEQGIGEH